MTGKHDTIPELSFRCQSLQPRTHTKVGAGHDQSDIGVFRRHVSESLDEQVWPFHFSKAPDEKDVWLIRLRKRSRGGFDILLNAIGYDNDAIFWKLEPIEDLPSLKRSDRYYQAGVADHPFAEQDVEKSSYRPWALETYELAGSGKCVGFAQPRR